MQIVCPTCNAAYTIKDSKIPQKRSVATCKKCSGKIIFTPQKPAINKTVMAPPEPKPAQTPPKKTGLNTKNVLAVSEAYPELRALNTERFHVETIFLPDKKGRYKNRQNDFRMKVLQAVQSTLKKGLGENEHVMKVAKGTAYYPAEIFFGNGFLTMLYNHYAIVGTNERLLFININSRVNRCTHYVFQMRYENIKKTRFGFLSGTLLLYENKGKRRTFRSVKRYMGKEMKQFIDERIAMQVEGASPAAEVLYEEMCPKCFVPLQKGLIQCPQCKTAFKVPKRAFLKSLLLPGWGDIYLGHKALGSLELMSTVLVWAAILSLLVSGEPGSVVFVCLMVLFYNGMDGLFTYHMAKKGYMKEKVG